MASDYEFQGFFDDDAKMIHKFLEEAWVDGPLKDKRILFFDEMTDPAQFNFNQGEIQIRIYADDIQSEPKGIGYDSESSSRTIRIDIRGIDRDSTIQCADQIRAVLQKYRLRPGNRWQTLQFSSFSPIYPSFKFYHTVVTVTLRRYYEMLPNVHSCGIER